MIETVAAFLNAVRAHEHAVLAREPQLNNPALHRSSIGRAYEGVTEAELEVALPPDLDLRVVTGQVEIEPATGGGTASGRSTGPAPLSGQVDVMVVVGEGRQLGRSRDFLYPIGQVLAVVEVKRTLTARELADAHGLLNTLGEAPDDAVVPEAAGRAFREITGRRTPADRREVQRLPLTERFVWYALVRDATTPARIVAGHRGYDTATALRDALVHVIGGAVNGRDPAAGPRLGFGPSHLPDLVACGPHALLKLNGLPIASRMLGLLVEDGVDAYWPCYGLSAGRYARLLLEVVWTRIALRFPHVAAELFPGELDLEQPIPFLFARAVQVTVPATVATSAPSGDSPPAVTGSGAWVYVAEQVPPAELHNAPTWANWEPAKLTPHEALALERITRAARTAGGTSSGDPELRALFSERAPASGGGPAHAEADDRAATALIAALHRLAAARLVEVVPRGDHVLAADLSDPRLRRWLERDASPEQRDRLRAAFAVQDRSEQARRPAPPKADV